MKKILLPVLIILSTFGYSQTAEEYYKRDDKANLGDYRGAIQDFNRAIELDPEDTLAYYYRGLTKIQLGDKDGAALTFQITRRS